jgi:hypothetical protein
MMHRFQADFGFHDVCSHADLPVVLLHPNVKARPGSHSPTLSARLHRFDAELTNHWDEMIHSVVQWSTAGYKDHFESSSVPRRPAPQPASSSPAKCPRREGSSPCQPNLSSTRSSAQFISSAHVFEFVDPSLAGQAPMGAIRTKLPELPEFPKLEYDGKHRHICFHSFPPLLSTNATLASARVAATIPIACILTFLSQSLRIFRKPSGILS